MTHYPETKIGDRLILTRDGVDIETIVADMSHVWVRIRDSNFDFRIGSLAVGCKMARGRLSLRRPDVPVQVQVKEVVAPLPAVQKSRFSAEDMDLLKLFRSEV